MKTCEIEGCNDKIRTKGYCQKHYMQLWQYGRIFKRTINDSNKIINCGDYYEIYLYDIKHKEVARAKIDKEDLNKVKDYKWHLDKNNYVINTKIKLHQLILGKKDGLIIDHINHDTLDNRKQNLRHCTNQQNCMNNKSKGVSWYKLYEKWVVRIGVNYKRIHIGYFKNKQDAISARKKAEKKYFGEFY